MCLRCRYNEIEITALTELNNLIAAIGLVDGVACVHAAPLASGDADLRRRSEMRAHGGPDAAALAALEADGTQIRLRVPSALVDNLAVDLRVSLAWDTDDVDVDLHVVEKPAQKSLKTEKAYYGNNRTRIGGKVSRDFTRGYGPEEYNLRNAPPGKYVVRAHFYGSSRKNTSGATTALLSLFTDYGRATQKRRMITLRLDKPGGATVNVGTIEVLAKASEEEKAGKVKKACAVM